MSQFDESAGGRPTSRWKDELALAFLFLTRLPLYRLIGNIDVSDRPLMSSAWAFGLVGIVVGAVGGIAYWFAVTLGLPNGAAALIALAASTVVTGALHEDGLADVADGFGGGSDLESKKRIMRDSRIGSYGVLVLIFAIGLKAATLGAIGDPELVFSALIASHAIARGVLPAIANRFELARGDGLGSSAGRPDTQGALFGLGIATGIAVIALPAGIGLAAALVGLGAAMVVAVLAKQQIGGLTGDVYGAAEQMAEVAALLTITAYLAG